MKYTLEGYSQEKATHLGLDLIDLTLLRYYADFQATDLMTEQEHNGKTFYWVKYSSVVEELPILGLNKESIGRRMMKLVDVGVLEHLHLKNSQGSFSYFRFGPNYLSLVSSTPTFQKADPYVSKSVPPTFQKADPYVSKSVSNNSSTKDHSTKEILIIGKNPVDLPSKPDKPKVEKKESDPLEQALWESFLAITPTMSDYAIERKTTKTLATRIRNLNPKEPLEAGKALVSTYHELRKGRDKFWKDQPFTPRGMVPHLDRLWAMIAKEQEDDGWMEGLK